jgi:hypothetical protein
MKTIGNSQSTRAGLFVHAALENLRLACEALREAETILQEKAEEVPSTSCSSAPRSSSVAASDNLTREEAAQFLGVSISMLSVDVVTGRHHIPYFKVGRRVVYSRSQLEEWRNSQSMQGGRHSQGSTTGLCRNSRQ